jgi:hypothetical protein
MHEIKYVVFICEPLMVANIFWHAVGLVMVACGYMQTEIQVHLLKKAHLIAGKLHLDKYLNCMNWEETGERLRSQLVVYFINTVFNTSYACAVDEAVVLLCTESTSYVLSMRPVLASCANQK